MSPFDQPKAARRSVLAGLAGLGAASLVIAHPARAADACLRALSFTPGPFPLSTILADPRFRRRAIVEDRTGVPLELVVTVVDAKDGCRPIANAAVYVWHCDKDGDYSGYGNATGLTFLRGVQTTDARGTARFATIYPGWYPGRITHLHLQVFAGNDLGSRAALTTQVPLPIETNDEVYASPLYARPDQKGLIRAFANDGVFEGKSLRSVLPTMSGSASRGLAAQVTIAS